MHNLNLHNCEICPRTCGVNRIAGQRGVCGASATVEVARAALHHWEEPSVSGSRGSGAIFFAHCALRCVFCQNREISRQNGQGIAVSMENLAKIMLDLQTQGAHNVNLVSGAHYVPQIVQAIALARKAGLSVPVVYNSSGYESVETLAQLDGYIDIYLPDFKYFSNYYAERYSGAIDYPDVAKQAIATMVAQTGAPKFDEQGLLQRGTVIRHLLLPTLAGDTAQVLRYIGEHWADAVLVSLMRQYTPFGVATYPEINRTIAEEEYAEAVAMFTAYGLEGYLQEGEAIGESFIPSFHGEGVMNFKIERKTT